MPVTWCYQVSTNEARKVYCSTGFPVGCYVDSEGKQKDACVIQVSRKNDTIMHSFTEGLVSHHDICRLEFLLVAIQNSYKTMK